MCIEGRTYLQLMRIPSTWNTKKLFWDELGIACDPWGTHVIHTAALIWRFSGGLDKAPRRVHAAAASWRGGGGPGDSVSQLFCSIDPAAPAMNG